jgi:hypothetical protein
MKTRRPMGVIPSAARNLLFLLCCLPTFSLAQTPAAPDPELTLSEFRALLPSSVTEFSTGGADEIFFNLLLVQGREAAARQSLDRLAGWAKAAQARLEAESAPLLDVEMLRFAEARAEARLTRWEAERRRALAAANRFLDRPPDSPLVALTTEPPPSEAPPANSAPPASEKPSDFSSLIARFEQELLPQAHDLLAKTYQNYLFGGVTLSTLLWQEEQVRETELRYRELLVDAVRARSVAGL